MESIKETLNNIITVNQLYKYAVKHNLLNAEASIVLKLVSRERINSCRIHNVEHSIDDSDDKCNSANSESTIDFDRLIEYSTEDLLYLLSK